MTARTPNKSKMSKGRVMWRKVCKADTVEDVCSEVASDEQYSLHMLLEGSNEVDGITNSGRLFHVLAEMTGKACFSHRSCCVPYEE